MYCGFLEENDNCPECKTGVLDWQRDINSSCSCHINPPCGSCSNMKLTCKSCGYVDEPEPEHIISVAPGLSIIESKPRPLDGTKIDYRIKMHTNSSQIVEGVYPDGMAQADVLAKVKGTFGGHFEHFGGGKFRYIAYTD